MLNFEFDAEGKETVLKQFRDLLFLTYPLKSK